MTTIYCARVLSEGEWKLVGGRTPVYDWWNTYVFKTREQGQLAVDRWNTGRAAIYEVYEVIEVVYDEDEVGL